VHGPGQRVTYKGKPFTPSSLSAVSAWLRVAQATSGVNGVSSLPDLLNSNPAVQSVDARKPVMENSANGLPCLRFATNDVLVWPITAQSSASSRAGWGLWAKLDAASATQRLVRISTGTNGANGLKLNLSSGASIASSASADGGTFKNNNPAVAQNTSWHFLTIEYDSTGATDDAKWCFSFDAAVIANVISGSGVLGTLFAATGNILIGNGNDGVASSSLNGLIGPNIFAFASKMAGATTGLLTTAARTALMNFEAPT
jgi:hypothetical protein